MTPRDKVERVAAKEALRLYLVAMQWRHEDAASLAVLVVDAVCAGASCVHESWRADVSRAVRSYRRRQARARARGEGAS